MFDPTTTLASAFGDHLAANYRAVYGETHPDHSTTLRTAARLVLERIASSDALYHDVEHTMNVTLVGQAILAGRFLEETVTAADWTHFTIATLAHDIGYLRGICPGDDEDRFVTDLAGSKVEAPRGASDAFLTPYHVERGKIFVRHRAAILPDIDGERLARAIELTRFPVPHDEDHQNTADEPGLIRAADLIGQLGDPLYPRKTGALYQEFVEIGVASRLGYNSPADLADHYPRFFWSSVEPYVGPALKHLDRTIEGKRWVAQLYAHVFVEEHRRQRPGPQRQ
jgi:hypothetical protein